LARQLSDSAQVQTCVATQALRYGISRNETTQDACSSLHVTEAFDVAQGNIRELFLAITQTDAFLNRRIPE
jgi:hypothetical protein